MAISEHLSTFGGKSIVDWYPDQDTPLDPNKHYRISVDWETEGGWNYRFAQFLSQSQVEQLTGIIVGNWTNDIDQGRDSSFVVEALVNAHARFPQLTTLFLGDITYEENELSWIEQSDLSPQFQIYPNLEHFGVRGGNGLVFNVIQHDRLKTLWVQAGGLEARVLHDLARAELPSLEHLEVWLGTRHYGWDGTIEDVEHLIQSLERFPRLTVLGLCNSEIADQIASRIVNAPILNQLTTLDLSLGILTDNGAEALLNSPNLLKLKSLRLHYHYCSDEMVEKLSQLPIEVLISNQQQGEQDDGRVWRYVMNGE